MGNYGPGSILEDKSGSPFPTPEEKVAPTLFLLLKIKELQRYRLASRLPLLHCS